MFDPLSLSGCLLCDEVNNDGALSLRLEMYDNSFDKILFENEHFLVIPDISPIVEGHSLLITKKHFTCFAQVQVELLPQLHEIKERAISFTTHQYLRPLLFEHGSVSEPVRSGVCVHHAHIHILPVKLSIHEEMDECGELLQVDRDRPFFGVVLDDLNDYLYYEDQTGQAYLISELDQPVPCQFIRRFIAQKLGNPSWNWKSVLGGYQHGSKSVPNHLSKAHQS